MSRLPVCAIVLAFLASPSFASPSFASEEQPERLCLGRVCLGDDVSSLRHLPWEPVKSPVDGTPLADAKLAPDAQQWIERRFRWTDKAFEVVAPYLLLRKLDSQGIRALSGIVAVCDGFSISDRLRARYTSRDGNTTVVSFEPAARSDSKPSFVVASISRFFGEVTAESLRAIRAQVADRYAGFPTYSSATRPGVRFLERGARGPTLTLLQPYGALVTRAEALRRNPACVEDAKPR